MQEQNFVRSLKAFSQRRPFKPFIVELASGCQVTIEHPEALAHRGSVAVYINPDGEYTLFDHTAVTKLKEVTANGAKHSHKQA